MVAIMQQLYLRMSNDLQVKKDPKTIGTRNAAINTG
jgi:hypothetical protein